MAKRKKKQSSHQIQKLEALRCKKGFIESVSDIAAYLGNKTLFSRIPSKELEVYFMMRYFRMRIIQEEGNIIKKEKWKKINEIFCKEIDKAKIKVLPEGLETTLEDYCFFILSLISYTRIVKEDFFPAAKEFMETFKPLIDYKQSIVDADEEIRKLMILIIFDLNNLSEEIFIVKRKLQEVNQKKYTKAITIKVAAYKPEKSSFIINNIVRPAYRVCFSNANSDLVFSTIKPSDLGLKGLFAEFSLDVFVQSHTLERLKERLDNIKTGEAHYGLFESIINHKYIAITNKRFLIEYILFEFKLGYLVADIIGGVLLIRTFLFLTNNTTPEGEKLNKMLNIEKLDKEYLVLDKFSTFTDIKFKENEKLKKIIDEAGCSSLYEYKYKTKDNRDNPSFNPEKIINYLEKAKQMNIEQDFEILNSFFDVEKSDDEIKETYNNISNTIN